MAGKTNGERTSRSRSTQKKELKREETKSTRRSDALLGYLIPVFFVVVASYQEVAKGQIDKYVIAALMIFGLGALGWNVELIITKLIEARVKSEEK